MTFEIIDGDGHVTETWEQIARHLDQPYRQRPLQRLDEEWEKRGHAEAKLLTKSPTEYVRGGNIYFSCETDEPLLPQALAYVGADRIMYASDFPHWDHSYPKSVKELADRADVTDEQKASVFAGAARRFYDLK